MSFLFLASKIHWYFKQGNSHSDHWAESGCVGSQVMSCKHFRISLCLTISYSVFWILGLTCMGTLRGSSPYGSLNPFLDGWWRPKLCLQVRQHVEGQVLVLYSDFGFQKQKLVSSMPRLYKLGDAIEELFNSSLCLHMKYIPLLLLIQWPVNTWFPCGTWSGQKGSFFIPADSLFPGDQVTRGVNSVFIYSSPLSSLLPGV